MNCEEYRIQISTLQDGELNLPEQLELKKHLEECPACRRDSELTGQLEHAITGWRRVEKGEFPVPEGAWPGIRERITAQARRALFFRRIKAAAAALVIASLSYGAVVFAGRQVGRMPHKVEYGRLTTEQQMSADLATAVLLGTSETDLDSILVGARTKELMNMVLAQ
jgi:anti-sigma factor RsiW